MTWCRASHFPKGPKGGKECISSLKTREEDVEGEKQQVVTSFSFKNADGNVQEVKMDSKSCTLFHTRKAEKSELKQCGFFCLFHILQPSFLNEKEFGCEYIPPNAFGAELLSPLSPYSSQKSSSISSRVEMITMNLICERSD